MDNNYVFFLFPVLKEYVIVRDVFVLLRVHVFQNDIPEASVIIIDGDDLKKVLERTDHVVRNVNGTIGVDWEVEVHFRRLF